MTLYLYRLIHTLYIKYMVTCVQKVLFTSGYVTLLQLYKKLLFSEI